ncbi:MAG: TrgA family protein [Pseudomonadota bacterium]
MPTAARLVAAVLLGGLAWYVSELIEDIPAMIEDPPVKRFSEINAVLGALCGWFVLGSRSPDRYAASFSHGLTAVIATIFWVLLIHSGNEMIDRALKKLYDTPMQAVVAVFQISVEDGAKMASFDVIVTLFVGGLVAGIIATFIGRRYP